MVERRDPRFLDKEPVREWGRQIKTPFDKIGINNLRPENPKHMEFVHGLTVPPEVITDTTKRYLEIFERLTGMSLAIYQTEHMIR
jgi:hypothetical protein